MSKAKLLNIVEILIRRSASPSTAWKATADEYTYLLAFPDSSVTISREPREQYRVAVQNHQGREVESFQCAEGEQEYASLEQLFTLARAEALQAAKIIDALLARLSQEYRT